MSKKPSRNDPCPCGSGKKYKQCCWGKEPPKRKISATWLNNPVVKQMPDLLERTFKDAIHQEEPPVPPGLEEDQKTLSEDNKSVE